MRFQGTQIHVAFAEGAVTVAAHPEGVSRPIRVGVGDDVREICPGERCRFRLRPASHAGRAGG
jgi:hypothetical protein